MPGQVVDYLPEEQLAEVKNLDEFAGILALDKWTANANGRQAVFTRRQRERRYKAVFIDFGYCFHAGEWRFEDAPLRGVYYRNDVYREITGWESLSPGSRAWRPCPRRRCGGRPMRSRRSGTAATWKPWKRWWSDCWRAEPGSEP